MCVDEVSVAMERLDGGGLEEGPRQFKSVEKSVKARGSGVADLVASVVGEVHHTGAVPLHKSEG